jgi:uncharacterized protein YxeA
MNINGSPDSIETANPQTILLMLLAVAAMIILSVCLLALIVYLRCKICLIETVDPETGRDANDPVNRVGGTRGIDEATLDSYPKMLYSGKGVRSSKSVEEEDLEAEDKTCCSICLSDYRESEEVRVMPDCGHMFHAVCIDQWLRGHASCPVCRTSPQLRAPLPEEPRLAIVSQP